MRGLRLGFGVGVGGGVAPNFSPTALFSANEEGGWYDIDPAYMFQDSAGTSPVTATGQTVGLVLDRSGRGNHLSQPTLANRPIYGIEPFGGRRNLLTYTEQFDNAAWAKTGGSITSTAGIAPDGSATADTLTEDAASNPHRVNIPVAVTIAGGSSSTASVYLKANGRRYVSVSVNLPVDGNQWFAAKFDLQDGVVSGTGTGTTGTYTNSTITSFGNGWYRCTVTGSIPNSNPIALVSMGTDGTNFGPRGSQNYVGDGTSGILIWGAQLETGSTATAYQRVTDQWNVTQAGVPSVGYLQYDGSDDWFVSPTITPGIDKAQVFAGVRKLSDAAIGMVAETSSNAGSNNGSLYMAAPLSTGASSDFAFSTRGTSSATAAGGAALSPISRVLTGIGDIAADTSIIRINGAQAAQSSADQGTGNYLAYPLYVGRRGGTTFPYNGRIYSLIVRFGANLTADQIAQTEAYVNSKTGAY